MSLTPSELDALPTQDKEWEGAQKPVPKGVYPCFLTMTTQEKFGCREREDVTREKPYVYVSKQFFLDDIQFRGAISDFHPMKALIVKYPEDDLMLCWDEEEWYGQNFFLSHSVDVKNAMLADEAKRAEAAAAGAAGGDGGGGGEGGAAGPVEEIGEWAPPESKEWVSQGSEAEIAEEAVVPTRAHYVLSLTRRRREFDSPYKFSDRDSDTDPNLQYNDCRPYKDPNFELQRWTHDLATQAVPEQHEVKTQTTWFRPANKALQYDAIAMADKEQQEVLASEGMHDFLTEVRARYEDALQQNETVDIFQDDFAALADEDTSLGNTTDSELRELQSFNHLTYCTDRSLIYLDWQPNVKGVIATANSQRQTFEEKMAASGKVQTGYVLLWSFSDPIHPQFVLEAPADVYCFRFCPSNPDVVVGGLASGQVVMWDLAEAREAHKLEKALTDDSSEEGGANTICAQAKIFSAVDQSHKRTVTDLQWLPPSLETGERNKFVRKLGKQQDQFLTIAGDGQLLVWDVRRAREVLEQELGKPKGEQEEEKKDEKKKKDGWGPSLKMPLTHPDSGNELAATSLILDVPPAEDAACRMFTVTEDGEFVTVGLLDPQAENQAAARGARTSLNGHFGPCTGMMRSPFVPDVYLSVGDWSFNLWKDGVSSPLFVSPFAPCFLTCGAWSPTRPGAIFIGRADGGIDVWDLLDRSHEPSMSFVVASGKITKMMFQEAGGVLTKQGGQLLAVGDDQGTAHILEVPRTLRRAQNNEKGFTLNFFEREHKRVEYVMRRAEVRAGDGGGAPKTEGAEEGAEEPTGGGGAKAPPAGAGTGTAVIEPDDEKLEMAFQAMELAFKEEMGIVDEGAEGEGEGGAEGS